MNTFSILAGYGSLELKRAYRKNMAAGIIAASVLFLAAAVIIAIITNAKAESIPILSGPAPVDTIIFIDYPEPGPQYAPIDQATQKKIMSSLGEPKPIPDSLARDDAETATDDDLRKLTANLTIDDIDKIGENRVVVIDTSQLLPEPGQFIPRDEEPVAIEVVQPIYPPMAMRASITGKVWVNVLIDKEGKVRDVNILKGSGANAGFEEAAIDAAWKTTWKPAFSNGLPVAVWLQYSIDFILK